MDLAEDEFLLRDEFFEMSFCVVPRNWSRRSPCFSAAAKYMADDRGG